MEILTADCSANLIADRFLMILPSLRSQLDRRFGRFPPELRDEALQEATAGAFAAFVRLWRRNRQRVACPTPLARYAIAHWFAGRRLGKAMNAQDVSSWHTQQNKRFTLERLDCFDERRQIWQEVTVEDRRTPVPDQAAFRIDFPAWLGSLTRRDRKIAVMLARGATTTEVAKQFRLTLGRVSQLRREFYDSWLEYHGETDPAAENQESTAGCET